MRTTRLPNAQLAAIPPEKITGYLLAGNHPAGRAKAKFFKRFGFTAAGWRVLRDALLQHARTATVITMADTAFGRKYVVEGPLSSPDGRAPLGRAIWFIEAGEMVPQIGYGVSATGNTEMIKESDPVVLTTDLPEQGLRVGDVGWVALIHAGVPVTRWSS